MFIMNRIKELRMKKGKTLDQMQDETGIKRGTISNYENGKTEPKLETWQKLADYFDVPVGYLQGVTDEKELTAKYAMDIMNDIYTSRFQKLKTEHSEQLSDMDNLSDDDKRLIGSILRNFELDVLEIVKLVNLKTEVLDALKRFETTLDRSIESIAISKDSERAQELELGLMLALYKATLLVNDMAVDKMLSDESSINSIKQFFKR